jgi:pimeloyl-ACP methyl ester carboxylesterase
VRQGLAGGRSDLPGAGRTRNRGLQCGLTGLGESGCDFADSTFSSDADDLVRAADHLCGHFAAPSIVIGQSLGAAAVLACAHRTPEVTAVPTIGAPVDPDIRSCRRPRRAARRSGSGRSHGARATDHQEPETVDRPASGQGPRTCGWRQPSGLPPPSPRPARHRRRDPDLGPPRPSCNPCTSIRQRFRPPNVPDIASVGHCCASREGCMFHA